MIPLFELSHQTEGIIDDIEKVWSKILISGSFVSGIHVERFEQSFSDAHETVHAVAVANGTVALEMAMRALGVAPGDEVIVPTNSFIATAEAVSNAGGTPVLVDIDAQTANISVAGIRNAVSPHTVGVIGVHMYGSPFDVLSVRKLCDQNGLFMVEDAAQAHLARVEDRPVGGFGELATFSFYPGKNLGAPGEGGMITTNDQAIADELRAVRNHGQTEKNVSRFVGTNGRMTEIAAAVLDLKLPLLPAWNERRREIAATYEKHLVSIKEVTTLTQPVWATSVHHLLSIELSSRDEVRSKMATRGVETGLHYPIPIHRQESYQHLGYSDGALPAAEQRAKRLVSLPMYPGLEIDDIEMVVSALTESLDGLP